MHKKDAVSNAKGAVSNAFEDFRKRPSHEASLYFLTMPEKEDQEKAIALVDSFVQENIGEFGVGARTTDTTTNYSLIINLHSSREEGICKPLVGQLVAKLRETYPHNVFDGWDMTIGETRSSPRTGCAFLYNLIA